MTELLALAFEALFRSRIPTIEKADLVRRIGRLVERDEEPGPSVDGWAHDTFDGCTVRGRPNAASGRRWGPGPRQTPVAAPYTPSTMSLNVALGRMAARVRSGSVRK